MWTLGQKSENLLRWNFFFNIEGRDKLLIPNQSPSNILESTSAPRLKLKFLLGNIVFMLLMFMCNGFGRHDIIVVQVVNDDKVEMKKKYLQFVAIFHHYNKAAWWYILKTLKTNSYFSKWWIAFTNIVRFHGLEHARMTKNMIILWAINVIVQKLNWF